MTSVFVTAPASTDSVAIDDYGTRRLNIHFSEPSPGDQGAFSVSLSSCSHKTESYDNTTGIYGHFAKLLLFILLMSGLYAISKIFSCIHFNAQVEWFRREAMGFASWTLNAQIQPFTFFAVSAIYVPDCDRHFLWSFKCSAILVLTPFSPSFEEWLSQVQQLCAFFDKAPQVVYWRSEP